MIDLIRLEEILKMIGIILCLVFVLITVVALLMPHSEFWDKVICPWDKKETRKERRIREEQERKKLWLKK